MKQWPIVPLGELFDIAKGKVGIMAATPGEFPLVATGEKLLSHNEPHFEGDALCIPMVSASGHGHASIKRLHHIRGKFAVGSILCACVAKDEKRVSARYAFSYLSANKDTAIVPLMQGSANVTLKLADVAKIEIPLPPLPVQHALVARLDTLSTKTRELASHLDAIEAAAESLLALRFRDVIANASYRTIAEVAPAMKRPVQLEETKRYREIGARSFGKGLFVKPDFDAAEATWERPVWIETGDVVLSNIKAWEGAIALADEQHHGAIASHRYITCVPDKKCLLSEFLAYYLLSEDGMEKIDAASPGSADRNRTLAVSRLEKIEVPVPPLPTQRKFAELQATVTALKAKHAVIRQANAALVPATLERVFAGESA